MSSRKGRNHLQRLGWNLHLTQRNYNKELCGLQSYSEHFSFPLTWSHPAASTGSLQTRCLCHQCRREPRGRGKRPWRQGHSKQVQQTWLVVDAPRRDAGGSPAPQLCSLGKPAAKKSIYSLLGRLVPAQGAQPAADETGEGRQARWRRPSWPP